MNNKEKEILRELINTLDSIRKDVESLERKVAELQVLADPENEAVEAIDLSVGVPSTVDADKERNLPADMPSGPEYAEDSPSDVLAVPESAEDSPSDVLAVPESAEDSPSGVPSGPGEAVVSSFDVPSGPGTAAGNGDDFKFRSEPKQGRRSGKSIFEMVPEKKAVIDVVSSKAAWKSDIPGPEVHDIRSAISLNDRVAFIRTLFREDSSLFQDTVAKLNGMQKLDQALEYISGIFPEWKMESDDVYRFMMAVRRKLK